MSAELWNRFRELYFYEPSLGFGLDVSRMDLPADLFDTQSARIASAFDDMAALEQGAIANPDENRMVGHYWLRNSALAPTAEIRTEIDAALEQVEMFARDVHERLAKPERASHFNTVLLIGIGGSALGPEFVSAALTQGPSGDRMRMFFFDNTDPDGFDRTLSALGAPGALAETLTVVISKSGGTKETRNGMLEAKRAYESAGLTFAKHAVAVTGAGSELDKYSKSQGWIANFPMWDWVGGRTSELSPVGLLPAALQGIDIDAMLAGAREMDAVTRVHDARKNPSMLLALSWLHATGGRGEKDMVILPYKDRLELFSRYLQQLVMESLGKEKNLDGETVHQGIAVYGNKGSTDQHAYVQQLRDGVPNFFATFIEVLRDRDGASMEVDPGVTAGDYLLGFLEGTRKALYENSRQSLTMTIERVDARAVGMLIALYERAVGFYGAMVNVNAYHQPGVEAGKKAAAAVITLQARVIAALGAGTAMTAAEVAKAAGSDDIETVWKLLRHLSANVERGISRAEDPSGDLFEARFAFVAR